MYCPLYVINVGYSTPPSIGSGDATTEVCAAIAIVVNTFFICGLRVLFTKLSDPIGDDIEDLSILTTIHAVIDGAFSALSGPGLPIPSSNDTVESSELELDLKRCKKLSKAFHFNDDKEQYASPKTYGNIKSRRRGTDGLTHPEDKV